jgi:hypothetical protein
VFDGLLSAKATINSVAGTVPCAISFDPFGHLMIAEGRQPVGERLHLVGRRRLSSAAVTELDSWPQPG